MFPLKPALTSVLPRIAQLFGRLRHPTRRGIFLTLAAGPLLMLLYVLLLIPFTPGISDLRKAKLEQPARILSADGQELAIFKRSNRVWVKLEAISPAVVEALIATEDHRFYQHHGIDWRRTAGAALSTFSGDRQGGSTLTQQLARNLYPEEIGRAPTLTRKLKEAITALKIEALYSKQEILETYLNTVPFLYNAYGIEMAARTYFDTTADALDVLQSATLVGMLKGNSYYNPVLNPERALQRRNTVLAQMVKRQVLSPARFEVLKKKPLGVEFERQEEPTGSAPHFTQQLRKWLIAWADRNDYNIYADGLVVYTTLDSRLQSLAEKAVARQGRQLQGIADAAWGGAAQRGAGGELIRKLVRETPEFLAARQAGQSEENALKQLLADRPFMQALRQQKFQVQAGFLALEPGSGQIKAWVGSRDFERDAFDHVQQAHRQPGSTFKPFVYAAAFQRGARPDDTLLDEAVEIPLSGGEVWRPTDEEAPTGQPITLRDGLVHSRNRITAQLMQQVGPARVARLAKAMGVRQSKLEEVPSLALGTSPVSLKEMVAAYATIANLGEYVEPMMVTRIEDSSGHLLEEFASASPQRALPDKVAYTLLDVMRGVIDRGTGHAIRQRFGIRADVAGKTGTTQDNADGWFILMQPQLVAGAWVGFNDGRVTLRSDYWGQGAHSALPVVGDFFQQALGRRLIDRQARFPDQPQGWLATRWQGVGDWFKHLFVSSPAAEAPPPHKLPLARPRPSAPPEVVSPAVVAPAAEEAVKLQVDDRLAPPPENAATEDAGPAPELPQAPEANSSARTDLPR